MIGIQNESAIFPIIEIVRREMQRAVTTQSIDFTGDGNKYINVDSSSTTNIVYADILDVIGSNDFELEFIKSDQENPKLLTGVKIKFTDKVYELINLIRENGKLVQVKDSVVIRQWSSMNNPLGMSAKDFIEYCENKKKFLDPALDEVTKTTLTARNQDLRDQYGLTSDQYSFEDLLPYYSEGATTNPLSMESNDFIEYCENKRLYDLASTPGATKLYLANRNIELRAKYKIEEDKYSYAELAQYLTGTNGSVEKVLLTVQVSLNYSVEGKMTGATSKTIFKATTGGSSEVK